MIHISRPLLTAWLTRKLSSVEGGRKSFPSGHSSTAFAGMTFLALYLVSQSAGYTSSKLSRLSIIMLPLFYATWVAISRVEDYVGVITIPVYSPVSLCHSPETSHRRRGRWGDNRPSLLGRMLSHVLAQPLHESLFISPIPVQRDGRSDRTAEARRIPTCARGRSITGLEGNRSTMTAWMYNKGYSADHGRIKSRTNKDPSVTDFLHLPRRAYTSFTKHRAVPIQTDSLYIWFFLVLRLSDNLNISIIPYRPSSAPPF